MRALPQFRHTRACRGYLDESNIHACAKRIEIAASERGNDERNWFGADINVEMLSTVQ